MILSTRQQSFSGCQLDVLRALTHQSWSDPHLLPPLLLYLAPLKSHWLMGGQTAFVEKKHFFGGQGHPKVSVANPYIDPPVPMKMAKGKSMYSKSLGTINGYFMVYLSFFYRYLEGQMLYVTRHITNFLDHPASLKSISKALSFSSSGSCPKSVFELITLTFLGTTERCQGKQLQQP